VNAPWVAIVSAVTAFNGTDSIRRAADGHVA
jgi:hypothetical protein